MTDFEMIFTIAFFVLAFSGIGILLWLLYVANPRIDRWL